MVENLVTYTINATTMKKWVTLSTLLLLQTFGLAQNDLEIYNNHKSKLWLSNNQFFQYQMYDGLFFKYLRGDWKKENNHLILTESYHSEKSENLHHIRKAPKFDYTTAKRITTFKIKGNKLILVNQEIQPKDAQFQADFEKNFFSLKD